MLKEKVEQSLKNIAKNPLVMETAFMVGTIVLGHPLLDSLNKVFTNSAPDHRTTDTVNPSFRGGDRPDWQTDEDKQGIPLSTLTATPTSTRTPTLTPTSTFTPSPTPTPVELEPTETPVEEENSCIRTGQLWRGEASYYSADGCLGCSTNQVMANGEIFNQWAKTLAFMRLPLNSVVLVTNLENGISSLARVTDRGGFEPYGRIADLSLGLKDAIMGYHLTPVKIEGCYSR